MALVRPAKPLEDQNGLHLLTVDVLVLRKFGPSALAWTSEVLRTEIEKAFGPIGPVTWQRVQAARAMHLRSSFWEEWEVFEKCSLAIVGRPVDFEHIQPLEVEDLAVSVVTAARIDSHPYVEDVKHYIAATCLNDGCWYVEEPLQGLVGAILRQKDEAHSLPVASVEARLAKQPKMDLDSDDPAVVQVNRILAVREALTRYDAEVSAQLGNIHTLLGSAA